MTFRTCASLALFCAFAFRAVAADLGEFSAATDVGNPKRAGSTVFDPAKRTYTITGGGKNMWGTNDAFQFVWKKVSGDVTLSADVAFVGTSKEPHRKACLMVRQSLDPDSAYADVVVHGDGSAGLQMRWFKSDTTHQTPAMTNSPTRLQLTFRAGRTAKSWFAKAGEELTAHSTGHVDITAPYFIGLGVCAHNDDELETAVFSNVKITQGAKQ